MLSKISDRLRKHRLRAAVVILVGIIFGLGLWDLLVGTHQLSAYDTEWNDLGKFRSSLEGAGYHTSSIISTPLILNLSEGVSTYGRVLVIIGVERPYLAAEISNIRDFVFNGGNLILADDYGYGNALGNALGQKPDAGVGFSGEKLFSSDFDRNPAFVRVNATMDSTGRGVVYHLVTDRPTALLKVTDAQTLGKTGTDSWLDENGNGERDLDERSNPYPVVASVSLGEGGNILVVSDPGLFINDVWNKGDNAEFVLAYIQHWFSDAKEFVFDETRHKPETFREGAWRTGLMLEVLALDNIYGKGALVVLSLVGLIAGALTIKPPAEWRHEDTLGELTLHHLAERRFRPADRERLRAAFLEKVRLALNLFPDEFALLGPQQLREAIADEELARLVERPQSVRPQELEGLAAKSGEWRRG